ncbi:MAG: DUF4406 domain-containing protein [Eggerthellaceae bacterium]|nr:DUF4406 domain-containing protein [Eggerthellaceae bacterium]
MKVKGMTVYLSGPMTGWENFNKEAFDDAERKLRELGAVGVFNPASSLPRVEQGWEREDFMLDDLDMLTMKYHSIEGPEICPVFRAVVLLPFWWASKGARLERRVARAVGIPVVRLRDCE